MRNYTEEIRAQHDNKIYREVITFSDLNKNGNKIIVELSRGRRGKAEYIAVDVTRLDGEGVYTGAMDLNPQVKRQERKINGDHATDADKIRIFFNDSTCKGLDLQK